MPPPPQRPRRILIVSSHPLFGDGLRSLLRTRPAGAVEVVGLAATTEAAVQALGTLTPDVVIVDYDDKVVNRDEFLARFVEGDESMRVALVSLQAAGAAVVYDRRPLAVADVFDWLKAITAAEPEQGRDDHGGESG